MSLTPSIRVSSLLHTLQDDDVIASISDGTWTCIIIVPSLTVASGIWTTTTNNGEVKTISLCLAWTRGIRVTCALSFDGLLLLGAKNGDIAVWSLDALRRQRRTMTDLALAPNVFFSTLSASVISLAGAFTRHVPAAGALTLPPTSHRFSPHGLVILLANGAVLTAAWDDILMTTGVGGASVESGGGGRQRNVPTFRRWALGSHRAVNAITSANPIASPLFSLPWEPSDRFASAFVSQSPDDNSYSGGGGGNGGNETFLAFSSAAPRSRPQHAVFVAAGRDPSLATYHADTATERKDGMAELAGAVRGAVASVVLSLAGDARALRRVTVGLGAFVPAAAVSWLAGFVGGGNSGEDNDKTITKTKTTTTTTDDDEEDIDDEFYSGDDDFLDSDDDVDDRDTTTSTSSATAAAAAGGVSPSPPILVRRRQRQRQQQNIQRRHREVDIMMTPGRIAAREWRDTLPTPLVPDFSLADVERRVDCVISDPSRRLVLATDAWGRVLLIDASELLILRVWKGYRDAQVGWLTAPATAATGRASLCAVIYAPRRLGGVIEIWRVRHGERIGWLRVPPPARLIYTEDDSDRTLPFPIPRCHIVSTIGGSVGDGGGGGEGFIEIRELKTSA